MSATVGLVIVGGQIAGAGGTLLSEHHRDAFVKSRYPVKRALQFLNTRCAGSDAKLFYVGTTGYFCNFFYVRAMTVEGSGHPWPWQRVSQSDELFRLLREDGFSHVLIERSQITDLHNVGPFQQELRRRARLSISGLVYSGRLQLLYEDRCSLVYRVNASPRRWRATESTEQRSGALLRQLLKQTWWLREDRKKSRSQEG